LASSCLAHINRNYVFDGGSIIRRGSASRRHRLPRL
jgi:hypothetical protein